MTDRTGPTNLTDLAGAFEEHRTHLRAVAYRMLGSVHEADDAVQEAWLRLSRAMTGPEPTRVDNLGGWLTTTISRLCLDALRTRGSRRETALPEHDDTDVAAITPGPEADAVLADRVGAALQVVLASLSPSERLAFVLHDLFAVPFDEVGHVMGRSSTAVRQLASRGRRRARAGGRGVCDEGVDEGIEVGIEVAEEAAERRTHRRIVEAFLTASKEGDFNGLLDLLDPDAVVRADGAAIQLGGTALTSGSHAVAHLFSGRAKAARLVTIDGYTGAAWSLRGELKVAFAFHLVETTAGCRIAEIEQIADPEVLVGLAVGRFAGGQRQRPSNPRT